MLFLINLEVPFSWSVITCEEICYGWHECIQWGLFLIFYWSIYDQAYKVEQSVKFQGSLNSWQERIEQRLWCNLKSGSITAVELFLTYLLPWRTCLCETTWKSGVLFNNFFNCRIRKSLEDYQNQKLWVMNQ